MIVKAEPEIVLNSGACAFTKARPAQNQNLLSPMWARFSRLQKKIILLLSFFTSLALSDTQLNYQQINNFNYYPDDNITDSFCENSPPVCSYPLTSNVLHYYRTRTLHQRYQPAVWQKAYETGLLPGIACSSEGHSPLPDEDPPLINNLDTIYFSRGHQQALLDLLAINNLTLHNSDLKTIVLMTQGTGNDQLAEEQRAQRQNWRRTEGDRVTETHVEIKEQMVPILERLNAYNAIVPVIQSLDYTLLLGASIQEMQHRVLMLLAVFDDFGSGRTRNLGKVKALTCDHAISAAQLRDDSEKNTFFPLIETEEISMESIGEEPVFRRKKVFKVETGKGRLVDISDLTEESALEAILYSLERMCNEKEYFHQRRYTATGYHPTASGSYLPGNSPENYLYRKEGHSFRLTEKFRAVACRFIKNHQPDNIMTPELDLTYRVRKSRPTTKKTAKFWLQNELNSAEGFHPCFHTTECHILVISNQPSARYQQLAVFQGLQDILPEQARNTPWLYLAAPGTTKDIPTDAILDNLARSLFLISEHPEY